MSTNLVNNYEEMTDEQFYAECAALLGSPHEGEPFRFHKRTRWNNREPGQGRFPGRGIIRSFGSTVHVALLDPAISMTGTKEEVLDRLRKEVQ
jgi:hypothetical protein